MSKIVYVQLGTDGRPIRIFRDKRWRECPAGFLLEMPRAEAVRWIREKVFSRSRNPTTLEHECEHCGRNIYWYSFEMNEKIFKGKGGEVSLDNCEALCHDCHQGNPDSVHGDRRWQTSKTVRP